LRKWARLQRSVPETEPEIRTQQEAAPGEIDVSDLLSLRAVIAFQIADEIGHLPTAMDRQFQRVERIISRSSICSPSSMSRKLSMTEYSG
jgi:hypothetical protein